MMPRLPESWKRPIEPGEMNPISRAILGSLYRFVALVLLIYAAGWLAHGAMDVFLAGWNSR